MSANRFLDPSSASARLFAQAQRLIPGGTSKANFNVKPHPFYVASGRGCRITDLDGVERLDAIRSEEHTSELQSQSNLVCRLLLEKKKNINRTNNQDNNSKSTEYSIKKTRRTRA